MSWCKCIPILLLLWIITIKPASGDPAPQEAGKQDTGGYMRSKVFYDSVHRKFSRNKFTQMLYRLAFIPPDIDALPKGTQVIESQVPYSEHKGKVIRNIDIETLPPFGVTIYDTTDHARTGVGKALNNLHVRTHAYIIRRRLLFKPGEPLDPFVLADNERIIRDLSSIDNVRFIVTPAGADSVDIVVVAKDVWSIGLDVPLVTPSKLGFRLYDANFLGLGDRLTLYMTTELYRAPFFRFDGASYTFSNIFGSFIDAGITYNQDNTGNQLFSLALTRPFITNNMKWAGGAGAEWIRSVNYMNDSNTFATRYDHQSFWLGRAFILKGQKHISRLAIAGATHRRDYTFRPSPEVDSNHVFSNNFEIMGSLSFSQNNYYVTDYIFEFGKTENLPYGRLLQAVLGNEYNEFYTRFYLGINLIAGNYFSGFGYLQGYLKVSTYLHNHSSEDGILKANLHYFTPLIFMAKTRYKFRTFMAVDYRTGFNMRSGNRDYFNAEEEFNINHLSRPNAFHGTETVTANIATIIFTPWYVYGFRFGLLGQIQVGAMAEQYQPLVNGDLFIGFGAGLMIKNYNLVFPTFLISGYLYPVSPEGVPSVQGNMSSVYRINLYDYNVYAPHPETLGN